MTNHPKNISALMPGLKRLKSYQKAWVWADVLAGVTVAAYLIPQCMAYGELAGLEPVVGLWAILPPMILYTLFGSSPQLSVGPESTTAVMTAAAISSLTLTQGSNYASLATVLAGVVGLVCIIGYGFRLGFLASLLSKPILIGYMAGVAIIMISRQLSKISGIPLESGTPLGEVTEFCAKISQLHWPTFILSLLVLVFLFAVARYSPKSPGPLLAVLLATATVATFKLDRYGVALVGPIPAGLPHLALPIIPLEQFLPLIASAIGIAIVGYSDNVLTARAFASRNHYQVDANQELLALGIANLGNGLMQGFPISSSGSRTTIGDSLGSKSQVFSLVALIVVIFVLLFLRPVLALFPKPALGAIVIYAATKLIEIPEFIRLKKFRRTELALALSTTVGVLLTDILVGVAIAVSLSILDLLARISHPHDAVLGEVRGMPGLHDIADWSETKTIPGLVIYRYDAPLCFANVEDFKRRAMDAIEAEWVPVEWFVLNTEAIVELDLTAVDALREFYNELKVRNITLAMARVKQDLYVQLEGSGLLTLMGSDHVYFTLHTAIAAFFERHEDD
ncbi:sulfate transporter (plasmid) [Gloeothece citriformis PCC 7424]|uniref:Sulfate transporter n=1 Tax=Gloeothece citriformis (strain PCC 7424) TaxID=65393 RepID=B7KM53_GLOC7|nr:solute carrier family 26 protein [Gloeothece citriformis]ACK73875.1 sulfate transporter [Gloeothece citriformis PCC 7424]